MKSGIIRASKTDESTHTTFTIDFNSQHQAGRILNIEHGSISNCLSGKRKTAKGWSFTYV